MEVGQTLKGDNNVVDKEIQYHQRRPQYHREEASSPTPLHPYPLPCTTSCTGREGKNLKHRDTGNASRGGKASSVS